MDARTTSIVIASLLAATLCAAYLNEKENDATDVDYDEVSGMVAEELEIPFSRVCVKRATIFFVQRATMLGKHVAHCTKTRCTKMCQKESSHTM